VKVGMKVEGLKELEATLLQLPAVGASKVLRSALMFAITPWQKSAREKVAHLTGKLSKAITKRSFLTKANNYHAEAGIVMNTKKRATGWKWHLLEFGTSHSKAEPFIRPAFDGSQETVIARFVSQVKKRIAVELAKVKK
jgi:HK97 gp10 family phage protein